MAKIPIILEAGRADGKLIKTNSIYDDNQEKFLSDKIKEIDNNHNELNDTVNSLTDIVNNNKLDIENKLEEEKTRATNTENNLRETINNITEISGSATNANVVTIDTIPNSSSSNVQQALTELFKGDEKLNTAIAEEKAAIMGTNRIADGAVTAAKLADGVIVQDTGLGEQSVMSQKVTSTKLNDLLNNIKQYIQYGSLVSLKYQTKIDKMSLGIMKSDDYSHDNEYADYYEVKQSEQPYVSVELLSNATDTFVNVALKKENSDTILFGQNLRLAGRCVLCIPRGYTLCFCAIKNTEVYGSIVVESIYKTIDNINTKLNNIPTLSTKLNDLLNNVKQYIQYSSLVSLKYQTKIEKNSMGVMKSNDYSHDNEYADYYEVNQSEYPYVSVELLSNATDTFVNVALKKENSDTILFGQNLHIVGRIVLCIPKGYTLCFCTVKNTEVYASPVVESLYKTIDDITQNINNLSNNTTEKIDEIYEKVGSVNVYDSKILDTSGYVDTSGNIQPSSNFHCAFIEVHEGDSLEITTTFTGNAFNYICLDSSNKVLEKGIQNSDILELSMLLIIKKNITKVAINCHKNGNETFKVTHKISGELEQKYLISNNNIQEQTFLTNSLLDRLNSVEKRNDFTWKELDKAYISINIDDNITNEIVNSFKEKKFPLCLSLSVDHIEGEYSFLKKDYYKEYGDIINNIIDGGGELMVHSSHMLSSSSTDKDFKFIFHDIKKYWYDNGYIDVHGIILPGGVGYDTVDFSKCVKWMRPYFEYSDLFGKGTGLEQYYNPRIIINSSLYNSLEKLKNSIEDSIAKKKWIRLYYHPNDILAFGIEELLDFINEKVVEGNLEKTNWKNMFDKFSSSKLEKRIADLEVRTLSS